MWYECVQSVWKTVNYMYARLRAKGDYIEDVSDTQYIVLHVRYDDSRRDSQLEGMQVCKERQRSRSS